MIYLLRHGEDDESIVGGYSDVSLTPKGIIQVKEISKYIKNNLKVNRIFTSDIKRAVETANIVNSYLNLDIIQDRNLRELDKGILTGKKKIYLTEIEKKNLETKDINERIFGGESMKDLYNRVNSLYTLGYFESMDSSLLITHRGFINMLYCILNDDTLTMDKEKYGVSHASLHELNLSKCKIKKIGGIKND